MTATDTRKTAVDYDTSDVLMLGKEEKGALARSPTHGSGASTVLECECKIVSQKEKPSGADVQLDLIRCTR